ncbi:hypothetical protein HHK36_023429 [Tetracentron sinense]|uniref:Uncharacterized protein n=1 Tax=Tetracentron sinense TaxID=13715 RepID=A0A835D582_TETSI|nr:hypothetical protein HHK36_023429 [Tetracentron sinense]
MLSFPHFAVGSDNDADVPDLTVDDGFDNTIETNHFLDYGCAELNMMFAMAERYMVLPFLEEIVETSNAELCEEAWDDSCVYIEIHQMKSCNQEPDTNPHSVDSDEADWFDPHLFIRNLPDLSDVKHCDVADHLSSFFQHERAHHICMTEAIPSDILGELQRSPKSLFSQPVKAPMLNDH